ncbi:FAD-dependent oxidoreductase [Paraburkholderia sp. Ac-20342]|uniref:NAD(P)/FAD-dependent oxidoreductase n=1 Tax=Paraburkholderia sp. Ac-20342 TaxID=2703889 RepID=UPI001981D425|nr:FAD-dependent oxidoreductase [Paraburkholderia sp. Ac-20342]MBN3846055.1 FAD-dependent oxidoreductase [Paraburkholderia sp. Ac-20342]
MNQQFDILIIGGGQAGRCAAQAARAVRPDARIAILGDEMHLPYDRPPLSKDVLHDLANSAACEKLSAAQFTDERIEVRPGERATAVDKTARVVDTAAGHRYRYGQLILATGSRVRRLPLPRELDDDVFYLRTRDDAHRLQPRLRAGANVAVIGGGFIGLEVAAAARHHGCTVTVIDLADRLLARVFPDAASRRVLAMHRAAGVDVRLGARIARIEQGPQVGVRIALQDTAHPVHADLIVIGIGVIPNTELAQQAGLAVDDGILVDAYGRTDDPYIFAAGEVTRHPVEGRSGLHRIESWQVAELQARAAGATAAGEPRRYDDVPWFWSDQLGVNIQMLGHIPDAPVWVMRGTADGAHSLFAFDADGRVTGAIAFDAGRDISALRRVLAKNGRLDPIALADPKVSWRELMG